MTNMDRNAGDRLGAGILGPGGGMDNPGEFSTTSTKLADTRINIARPIEEFVRKVDYRVSGTAKVRMRTAQFIKVGNTGHTTSWNTFVTTGFTVSVALNGQEHQAQVTADGDIMRWSLQVKEAQQGDQALVVTLKGHVTESTTETKGGNTTGRSEQRAVSRSVTRPLTVDTIGPELLIHEVEPGKITTGPPYAVTIEGTARDKAEIHSVQWQHGGATDQVDILGQGDSGDEVKWQAVVTVADRGTEQEVLLSARDNAGNTTEKPAIVPPDVTPPKIAISQPPFNPHRVLWRDGGTTVEVEGMAFDQPAPGRDSETATPESEIAIVQWQLNTGDEGPAEQISDNWALWRAVIPITEGPGIYALATWAVDAADNESERHLLEIHAQTDEQFHEKDD